MDYETYSYHCSGHITTPDKSKMNDNIKGLELEISDYDTSRILDDMIYEDVITSPENEGHTDNKVAIEDDGSVFKELIFKADKHRNLMMKLKEINKWLNPDTVYNEPGTSAHIHLNRRYLEQEGIPTGSIVKAGEFIFPFMYKVSGRDTGSMQEWARSTLPCAIDADLLARASCVDKIGELSYNRYNVVNIGRNSTIELRIFSNYFNFDYDYIKLYLELSDAVIDIANIMKGKSYVDNIDIPMDYMEEFFTQNRRRKRFYNRFNIGEYLIDPEEMLRERIFKEFEKAKHRIDRFNRMRGDGEEALRMIRIIRDLNQNLDTPIRTTLNLERPNYDNMICDILSHYENKINQL